ncbi:MAG: HEAT repeat domain-containing protein [Acidobacteriota bacterium]|nr:HEAT repeat domain-containing protein [Acidobacteriota bacterium]
MQTTSRLQAASLCVLLAVGGVACQSAGGKGGPDDRGARAAQPKPPASRSVAELRAALRDPDLSVRLAAVEELGHRTSSSQEAIDALVEALADPAPLPRRFAAGGLAEVKSPSAPMLLALAKLLRDAEPEPRDSAARSLAALAPRAPAEAVKDLATLLAAAAGDKEDSVRAHVVEALGALGAPGVRLVPAVKPALERALTDPSAEVRGAAAAAIGQLAAAGAPGMIALLTKALADPVHDVRKQAVIALEKIGPAAAPATRALARQLRGKEIYLRVFAADALTAIGPGARVALPELKAMVARGWKEIEGSPESEAKGLPDAVMRAIRSIEGKAPKKAVGKPASDAPVVRIGTGMVKGHFEDVNVGDFDMVDGIAYAAGGGAGTVVYAVSKPIASAALADSPCPMTSARALTALRDAGYVEVTLDSAGDSKYFAGGTPFGGSGREDEVGGHYWSTKLRLTDGRAAGSVEHREHGGFEFDLPLSSPKVPEVSEGDRSHGRRGDPSVPAPAEPAVSAAYRAVREAALKKDLNGLLAAQGFNPRQTAAIRGLDGIDADLAVFADRFLKPGASGEFQNGAGYGAVSGSGMNSKGKKFINFYWFSPCLGKLVLTGISENPQ